MAWESSPPDTFKLLHACHSATAAHPSPSVTQLHPHHTNMALAAFQVGSETFFVW
jgi:hypothetical protein